ncbi:MAG TPA: hypothetical protein VGZ73_28365 [Bryobacteraceae bacterium]|nr:hypothetical protein [Bryobacteraceae bacterium]
MIVWRTMVMYEEYPSETLVSEFRGQVHVDRPQRCHSDGITPRKYRLSPDRVGWIVAQRNLRKDDDRPAGSGDDGLRQFACIGIVGISVRIGREIGAVFFQNAAWDQDHRLRKIQCPNLLRIHVADPQDLRSDLRVQEHRASQGYGGRRHETIALH